MSNNYQAGSALIMVLWVLLVVGTIASFLIYRSELEWAVTVNLEKNMQAQELAKEILNQRLALLIGDETENDTANDPWYGQNGRLELDAKGYQITVLIEDEGSKPNLNLINENALNELVDEEVSFAPLLDWRDIDSEVREGGAESSYYQALNPGYKARDGFLSSVAELKQIKDGVKLYQLIAPEVTVYGKVNPNSINKDVFGSLLLSSGFDQNWVTQVSDEFFNYRTKLRFTSAMEFLRLNSVSLMKLESMKPLFNFSGNCNINLASEKGLKVALRNAGYKSEVAADIISRRNAEPFVESEIKAFFNSKNPKLKNAQDYFTTESRVIRIKIWLVSATRRYYVDAVYERIPGRLKGNWRVQPLYWQKAVNDRVPEIPKKLVPVKDETTTDKGGE